MDKDDKKECPDCSGTGKMVVDTGEQPICPCEQGERRRGDDDND